MVAYNFKSQHVHAVESGAKRHTLRAERKRHARVGEAVQLYTGMMHKNCRKLVTPDPICKERIHMRLELRGKRDKPKVMVWSLESATWCDMSRAEALVFAKADGFESVAELFAFFEETHGLPFEGKCIKW